MKFFRHKITLLIITIFMMAVVVTPVLAQGSIGIIKDNLTNSAEHGGLSTETTTIPVIIGQLINYMFGVLGIVFLCYTLIGGILWMVAGGNEEKVKRAVKFIIGGVEGLIVIFMAYALVYVVLAALRYATSP